VRSPSFPTARYQRQVITLGSPIRLAHKSQSRARRAFDRYAHLHVVPRQPALEARDDPPLVPATSIYFRSDYRNAR
jgi:hypothetical protein